MRKCAAGGGSGLGKLQQLLSEFLAGGVRGASGSWQAAYSRSPTHWNAYVSQGVCVRARVVEGRYSSSRRGALECAALAGVHVRGWSAVPAVVCVLRALHPCQ